MVERAQPVVDALTGVRPPAEFTAAERSFSRCLRDHLDSLLEGKRNRVYLLRRYPREPGRLGVIQTPRQDGKLVRFEVAEKLTIKVIEFIRSDTAAGPIAQSIGPDGGLVEVQSFPTKYPHIVIERTDRFDAQGREPVEITWCLQRLQNQRQQTQFNRLLDATNLAFELLRLVR